MSAIFVFEIIGTIAFAISGACLAIHKEMDIFGVCILGMTTAVGGGIIRDIILGITPPMAFRNPSYALVAILTSILVFLRSKSMKTFEDNIIIALMDTLGLGVFTVIGVRAGMHWNNAFLCVFVGALTGVGGGVLRDLFAGVSPGIFRKHFYATASVIGAAVTYLLFYIGEEYMAMLVGALITIVLRLLAAHYHWNLPKARMKT